MPFRKIFSRNPVLVLFHLRFQGCKKRLQFGVTMRDHWRGSRQGVFCAIGIGITPPRALAEGTIWAARCSLRCRNVPKIQSWTHQHWFLARGLFRVAGRASGVELEIAIVLPIPQMPRGCFRLSQSNTSRIDNGQIFPGDPVFFTC